MTMATPVFFFPVLIAAIIYFQIDRNENRDCSPIVKRPEDLFLILYDYIIIGAGSAGKFIKSTY